ncbi:formylmethanofuran dehydrogenase subunit C, partial [Candidatus Bathyarchaeota archaeon]|nr:formylmethanofuran dehydrogenase subunit C [Candidatus Bathyarchaeota archaeon]
MIILKPRRQLPFPVMAECINPDVFQDKSLEEIEKLAVWEGNKQKNLADIFKVDEPKRKGENGMVIAIQGDVTTVRRIGTSMTSGEILIEGNVGMHLGEEMKGGKITVHGSAESWAGSMMKGGTIEIHGSAGDYLGAPYRGCSEGMHGGQITVHGNVGSEAGAYMKKGLLKFIVNSIVG